MRKKKHVTAEGEEREIERENMTEWTAGNPGAGEGDTGITEGEKREKDI